MTTASDSLVAEDVVCLGCGCTCDDIALVIERGRIVEARNACALGAAWFGDGHAPARASRAGADCTVEEALSDMAAALHAARAPLIYLAPDITCEAQREAVALADLLRGALDTVSSPTSGSVTRAAQARGRASATLGEVRNRADLIVFWGVDPAERYPRFQSRYAPDPVGVHVPQGRRSRTVVAVDVGDRRGPADADVRISVAPASEVATLVLLTAALGTGAAPLSNASESEAGRAATSLAERIRDARYAAIVTEVESFDWRRGEDARRAEALILLSLAVNDATRGALISLRPGGNRSGAEAVATWQTGYPMSLDFTRGYPRYQPWSGSASALLSRGEVDVVLVLGAVAGLPPDVVSMLSGGSTLLIGPRASESVLSRAAALIDTGLPSLHEAGTVLRMDDVPLPVRRRISGPPSSQAITRALCERIVAMQADAHRGTGVRVSL
jgi:formylmethanofuran dehydrogenase subunit B